MNLSHTLVKPVALTATTVSMVWNSKYDASVHPPLVPHLIPPWVHPTLWQCALPISVPHLSPRVTGAGICWVWNWPSHFRPWTLHAPAPIGRDAHTNASAQNTCKDTLPEAQIRCDDLKLTFVVWPPCVVVEGGRAEYNNISNFNSTLESDPYPNGRRMLLGIGILEGLFCF